MSHEPPGDTPTPTNEERTIEMRPAAEKEALAARQLRWHCDTSCLEFHSTREVAPVAAISGQESAVDALRFGLAIDAPGQHVFVRGPSGTGRLTMIKDLLKTTQNPFPSACDYCYVHNFEEPDRPRLITLPPGEGENFRSQVEELIAFIEQDLGPGLDSDVARTHRERLENEIREELERLTRPLEAKLRESDLALIMVSMGAVLRPMIVPVINGEAMAPDRLQRFVSQGGISRAKLSELEKRAEAFSGEVRELSESVGEIQRARRERLRELVVADARALLNTATKSLLAHFPQGGIQAFLRAVVDDTIENGIPQLQKSSAFTQRYRVNLLQGHLHGESFPVVVESAPSVQTLLGTIEHVVTPDGGVRADHTMIHAGSLLRANGGYLILEARDVITEPGAWRALVRSLRSGKLDMVPPDSPTPWRLPSLQPEPVPLRLKVVLLGEAQIYYLLDRMDPDFPDQFKVLADFDTTIPREPASVELYAGFLSQLSQESSLLPFSAPAVGAVAEHGARIAEHAGRLTARFGRLGDIAREAAFVANQGSAEFVEAEHVHEAVRRTKRRADLPARQFRELVASKKIRVQLAGRVTGQVNGLAAINAGPLVYGFPSRITASIGPGTGGTINVEREAQLSGAIHTKGFYILGGLLRHLLRTEHPLAFDASIAFEQSYGAIDGDSASGAEICCLLSALTQVPLRQDLAMTGAIDQRGNILPIGAVNEKIEGFYDACSDQGLTGAQGVIIPEANVGDLMLRRDVVEAVEKGDFHVHAVDQVSEALELFTGISAGHSEPYDGHYQPGTLLHLAMVRAAFYWSLVDSSGGRTPGEKR